MRPGERGAHIFVAGICLCFLAVTVWGWEVGMVGLALCIVGVIDHGRYRKKHG